MHFVKVQKRDERKIEEEGNRDILKSLYVNKRWYKSRNKTFFVAWFTEALHVKHVHFINEKYTWNNVGLALLAPLSDLSVNLLANFLFDLACVAREQRQKSLRATRAKHMLNQGPEQQRNIYQVLRHRLHRINTK